MTKKTLQKTLPKPLSESLLNALIRRADKGMKPKKLSPAEMNKLIQELSRTDMAKPPANVPFIPKVYPRPLKAPTTSGMLPKYIPSVIGRMTEQAMPQEPARTAPSARPTQINTSYAGPKFSPPPTPRALPSIPAVTDTNAPAGLQKSPQLSFADMIKKRIEQTIQRL